MMLKRSLLLIKQLLVGEQTMNICKYAAKKNTKIKKADKQTNKDPFHAFR